MKFTDEELSRILSAHEAGDLVKLGQGFSRMSDYRVCLFQAAVGFPVEGTKYGTRTVYEGPIEWFDNNYDPSWSTAKFLKQLSKQGLV